jgi:F-type H+-transporting ATPase subunit b
MISLDSSILYQVVIFVILWLILSPLLFRPYLKVLEEREQRTSGTLHDTDELEHEGARLKSQYEEKIAQAQSAGAAAKEAILQHARQAREKILGDARDEAARHLEAVRQEVQRQLAQERGLAATEVSGLAREMASKILGRPLG